MLDDKKYIHSHIIVSDKDMNTKAGHLNKAMVAATCEIVLINSNLELNRKFSEEIGLNLLDI